MVQKRNFTIHAAYHSDGCPTKFKNKDYSGHFVSSSPSGAAKKALTQLCRVKKIKGRCTLYVEIRETTQGSHNKPFMYKVKREKLDKPIVLSGREIHYNSVCKSVKSIPKCEAKRKTPGPKRKSKKKMKSNKSKSKSKSR